MVLGSDNQATVSPDPTTARDGISAGLGRVGWQGSSGRCARPGRVPSGGRTKRAGRARLREGPRGVRS
jgi:hypothetical protein